MIALGALFALYSSAAAAPLVALAALAGGAGGAGSLIVHELGHVRAARRLEGVKPLSVSVFWLGAGTKFEGAYRSGRDQARVAIAGPAASFVVALVLLGCALIPMPRPVQYGVLGLVLLNLLIAVVSLLPVHPLDGHKLLVGLVWRALGTERRARRLVRRAGTAWLVLEGLGCLLLLIERPIIGVSVLGVAAMIYAQRHFAVGNRRAVAARR